MALTKGKKRLLIILGIIVGVLLIVLIIINSFLGNIIEGKINNALQKGDKQDYRVSLEDVRINILSGNVRMVGIKFEPDTSLIRNAKEGTGDDHMLFRIDIPVLRLVGINIYDAIVKKNIQLRKIEFKRAKLSLLKGKAPQTAKEPEDAEKKDTRLDSLHIKGIAGIDIGKIALTKCKFEILDLVNSDTIIAEKNLNTEFKGIALNKIEGTDDYFAFNLDNIKLELKNEKVMLPGGNYELDIKSLSFNLANSELIIKGLSLEPTYTDVYKLAKKLKFTSEIFNISVGTIHFTGLDLVRFVDEGQLFIDELTVSKLDLSILMDKRLPFNEKKSPKLPNQILKSLKLPLYIGQISIKNSALKYEEKMAEFDDPMTVTLGDFNVHIVRATSIEDSLAIKTPMTINLNAKLMKKAKFNIDFVFPLYQEVDTFFYVGSLGKAHFPIFNGAAFPAIGVKFLDGDLKSINFNGSANPGFNKGEFTMLYDNLNAEVVKKDYETKNKFFSWAANTALKKANPGKNGITRTAMMSFERVYYKGFGNIMWKTFQNGIINTISPVGKIDKELVKEQKEEKKKEKAKKKELRKNKDN